MKRLVFLLSILIGLGIIGNTMRPASAAVSSDFQPGRIMDDGVFFNPNTILPVDIQSFLNSKVPVCDTNHTGSGSNQPPFTCLKDYRQDTPNKWAEPGLCGDFQGGNKSSAEIIYYVGQSCGINPKVLIVLLEKEESLVTDTWPWNIQYRSATGFGCPDTAPCDTEYYGFFNQVYNAARQFKRYARDESSFRYRPYRDNYIQYNPNADCGGTNVYIQNQATAGLYNYTPYQPNASVLGNLYGSGDSCGAYGNKNFWRLYTDWFGSTYSALFSAAFYRQSAYPTLVQGESKPVSVEFRNNGNWDWHDDAISWPGIPPLHLAASKDINRSSIFSYGWPSAGRPNQTFSKVFESDGTTLATNQHLVKPGQIAKFDFNISVPWTLAPGTYRENFQPVLEGPDWNIGGLAWFDIKVVPLYKADFQSQGAYPIMRTNDTTITYIQYKNTGMLPWYDDATATQNNAPPIHLATTAPLNRSSNLNSTWSSANRPSNLFSVVYEADGLTPSTVQHLVKPGQIARFEFNVTARQSLQPNLYREYFQPVIERSGGETMGGLSWLDVSVAQAATTPTFFAQSAYPTIRRGDSKPVYLAYKNSGNVAWYDDTSALTGLTAVRLAASNPINRSSAFSYGWYSGGRPTINFSKIYLADGITLTPNQHVVYPGQVVKFEFNLTAPWTINFGQQREFFQPVLEGPGNWNIGGTAWLDVTVEP